MTPERACALVACGFPPGARPNPPGVCAVYAAQNPADCRLPEAILPHVVLRGVPDRLHRELKAAAARNCRSLNGEILARLTASVQAEPAGVETLLERIRQRRGRIGPVDLGAAALREMKDAGRP